MRIILNGDLINTTTSAHWRSGILDSRLTDASRHKTDDDRRRRGVELAYLSNRYVNPLHTELCNVAGTPVVRQPDQKKNIIIYDTIGCLSLLLLFLLSTLLREVKVIRASGLARSEILYFKK